MHIKNNKNKITSNEIYYTHIYIYIYIYIYIMKITQTRDKKRCP